MLIARNPASPLFRFPSLSLIPSLLVCVSPTLPIVSFLFLLICTSFSLYRLRKLFGFCYLQTLFATFAPPRGRCRLSSTSFLSKSRALPRRVPGCQSTSSWRLQPCREMASARTSTDVVTRVKYIPNAFHNSDCRTNNIRIHRWHLEFC